MKSLFPHLTNDYDKIIKTELNLRDWIFLSDHTIFDYSTNKKFLIKKILLSYAKNTAKEISNLDINDYEIIESIKYCCRHEFMPNILSETENFLELEYLNFSDWRRLTDYEHSNKKYCDIINDYCSYVKDLKIAIFIDASDNNQMINRKTGIIKNINISEIFPTNFLLPGLCNDFSQTEIIINTQYVWDVDHLNRSFSEYIELCNKIKIYWGIHNVQHVYIENGFDLLKNRLL